jgi:hypothetical protein
MDEIFKAASELSTLLDRSPYVSKRLRAVESTVGFNPIRFDSAALSSTIATWWGFVWSRDKLRNSF